jgi:polyribonucleotide nucleotidyltransferase
LNPGYETLKGSMLNMMVAGTESAVLMVESEANEMTEDEMLGGSIGSATRKCRRSSHAVAALAARSGQGSLGLAGGGERTRSLQDPPCHAAIEDGSGRGVPHLRQNGAPGRSVGAADRKPSQHCLATEGRGLTAQTTSPTPFGRVEKDLVRQRVLNGEPRIDGRDLRTVRPIEVEVGVLPKAHGSALFTRGETQALVVATLGHTARCGAD